MSFQKQWKRTSKFKIEDNRSNYPKETKQYLVFGDRKVPELLPKWHNRRVE